MDRELLVFYVEQGFSTYTISKKINKSQTTVSYWLKKYNLKTKNKSFKTGYHKSNKVDIQNQVCCICSNKLTRKNAYLRKDRNVYFLKCKKCLSMETKDIRKNNKQKAVEYKGGCCNKCSYNKNIAALEFHHLDPLEKETTPSKLINREWELLKNEIDKCVLLCSNCHREEHQRIDDKVQLEHNFKDFQLSNFSSNILTGKNTGELSCYMCDTVLTEETLASKKYTPVCKSCNSKRTINRIRKNKLKAVEYLGSKCSYCGYDECIRALEFHHLDPSKKSKDYNKNFNTWSVIRQREELEHCILLCSNCHREVHSPSHCYPHYGITN